MINYVFLGSQESLLREIFEKKKSPFYHFGMVFTLGKIPEPDFGNFLVTRLKPVTNNARTITGQLLEYTSCHPYYTQQLAFVIWEKCRQNKSNDNPVKEAVDELIAMHDMDYERWWSALNKTDKKLVLGLAFSANTPLSEAFYRKYDIGASSTVFSSLKRLMESGYIIKIGSRYELDDPFFVQWLKQKREA